MGRAMGRAEPKPDEAAEPKPGAGPEENPKEAGKLAPRTVVPLALLALLLIAGAVGYGIGYTARPDSGSELTPKEALVQARDRTEAEVSREMAARGFAAGKRSGRSHGIIAGGMAAESAVTIKVRQDQAGAAQSDAASAQSELAGMTAAPAPPVPAFDSGE